MAVPLPLADQFQDYIRTVKSANTAKNYRRGVDLFLSFCGRNNIPEADLPPNIIGLFSESLIRKVDTSTGKPYYAPSSVRVFVAGARKWLTWLRQSGIYKGTLFMEADLPKINNPPPQSLTAEHIKSYLVLASRLDEPARTALLLAPYCGLRGHELVKVRIKDIKPVTIKGRSYICVTVKGKGGKIRLVPLLPDGRQYLIQYLTNWRQHVKGGDDWLFPNPRTKSHIIYRGLNYHALRFSKMLKTSKLSLHTLRRTYATAMHRAGIDIVLLQKMLGHEDPRTTSNRYIAITEDDLVIAIDKTGARLVDTSKVGKEAARATAQAQKNALHSLASLPSYYNDDTDGEDPT